ncbi:MAG: twin-arginine translocation signal domain-containing protein [Actinomycetota bacterium]|nr:twin-arginine translocation signal domain-containing protein [Actinomycetota bacterium]
MSAVRHLSRRGFLGGTAVVGLGMASAGILGPATHASAAGRPISCWGDSLTMGVGAGGFAFSYPAVLSEIIGSEVYNGGRGGERSGAIAARQGGVLARVAAEVTIPASGYAVIHLADEVFFRGPVPGKVMGVDGSLYFTGSGTAHRFTRTSAGAETVVPTNTAFHATGAERMRGSDPIIWAGHNDDYLRERPGPSPSMTIEDNIAAMVAYNQSTGSGSNYLVLSLINGRDGGVGSVYYDRAMIEVNGNLARTYGSQYLDVHRYLVDQALGDVGLVPTPQDLIDIAEDIPPASLRAVASDHLNVIGYDALARYIKNVYSGEAR